VAPDNRFEGTAQVPSGASNVEVKATDPSGNVRTNTYQVSVSGAGSSFTYDANGNLTGDGTKTYEHDAENRLTRVLSGASEVARFSYDGLGRRVQKVAGGVTTTYIYDAESVIEERLSSGGSLWYVDGPVIDQHWAVQDGGGAASYYLADHLGSIVQVTNAAGQLVLSRDYDPYGNMLAGASQNGYAFTGRNWDTESGSYYFRARHYLAPLGRFMSEDPIRFYGGVNLYAYVEGDPVNARDPFGLRPGKTGWRPTPSPFCGLYIGWKAFDVMKGHGTRFTHCWASCEITKACGKGRAEQWENIKEYYDWALCGLGGHLTFHMTRFPQDNCNSAFQPSDYQDNYRGRSTPCSQGCWDRCINAGPQGPGLSGAPEAPPGPYGAE
jgi:RHS repeat-associated protein